MCFLTMANTTQPLSPALPAITIYTELSRRPPVRNVTMAKLILLNSNMQNSRNFMAGIVPHVMSKRLIAIRPYHAEAVIPVFRKVKAERSDAASAMMTILSRI